MNESATAMVRRRVIAAASHIRAPTVNAAS
jgi:hypothetical protein